VAAPSLAVFKTRLDQAWSTLGWWKWSLPMAGGLELGDLSVPFQPKPFCGSVAPTTALNREDKMFREGKGTVYGI